MQTTRETSLDLPKECDYIVAQAVASRNTIVIMGPLVFLAYASGDAFVLDMEDKYACQLCVDGEKQRYPLFDSGTKWAFQWPWKYALAKGRIFFERIDRDDSGGLPWMKAGVIEREITRYNRKAGTNYHL
ncbi:MAG: hypothetical protein ACLQU1_16120 [Bryobacteraceae bacterium]